MLWLGLDADAVWPLHIAAKNRPDDSAEEHGSGEVANKRIALVDGPVEELERLGKLVVDLEYRGDCEQYQETEVDH